MSVKSLRILLVGPASSRTLSALESFERNGWTSLSVETIAEANIILQTIRFDVVLAQENLPDGRGYELTQPVIDCSGSLLVSVALSESCLWLLAAEHGVNALGERAISPGMLEWEVKGLLNQRDEADAPRRSEPAPIRSDATSAARLDAAFKTAEPADERGAVASNSHPSPKQEIPPRRKAAVASGTESLVRKP
jgi:hypothetical protein